MTQKELTVLMVEPGKHPRITTLSWLYKRCREWVYNGDLTDAAPRTKKIVFEIDSNLIS